jgi:glycopeptide antibiotics resistance protein
LGYYSPLFWIYLLAVISLTLFPIPLEGGNPSASFQQKIQIIQNVHALNLSPHNFDTCWEFPRSCFNNLLGNILLTLPFGFGINFLFHPRILDTIWMVFALGLAIEGLQLSK